jgi:penicillin-binding protein 2
VPFDDSELAGGRRELKKRTKFLILRASIVAVFVILAGRLWYVQVVNSSYYKAQADISKIRLEPLTAPRGVIYDRYGHQLVFNAPSWNVDIVPHGILRSNPEPIYQLLSRLLAGHPGVARIAWMVQKNAWRPYAAFTLKRNVSPEKAMIIKQLHARLPGVSADAVGIRNYVEDVNNSLGQILGYIGIVSPQEYTAESHQDPRLRLGRNDEVGQAGIEASLEPYLHGINGQEQVEVDAGERPVRILNPGHTTPGDNVYLTIDAALQQQVAGDLAAALQHVGWSRGVAILEDVHTGRILAMVSLPSYDNNWFSGGISQAHYQALTGNPYDPLIDQAIGGTYPPGSIYKVITATAALQTGVATADRIIDDTGEIDLGNGVVFHGWTPPPGLGPVNIVGALEKSSDIFFYTVAGGNPTIGPMPSIGPDRLAYWARQYGLGSKTDIELPGEQTGLVPDSAWHKQQYSTPWHIGDSYNSAIGQGDDLVTPLQMVSTVATIANGGTYYRPRIVDHISGRVVPGGGVLKHDQIIQPFVPSIVRRDFVSPQNLTLVQEGMHASVQPFTAGGTSQFVVDSRIDAAGKTGTAETNLPNGTPSPDAWWIGYAPYNHPQVAVCVLVPNANAEGAYAAAPIAHKVLEDYFHLPPTKPNWLDDVSQTLLNFGGAQ